VKPVVQVLEHTPRRPPAASHAILTPPDTPRERASQDEGSVT
jgi:hypothetical protein